MQQWRIFLRSIDQQLQLRSPKLQMCRSNIWISSIVLNWWLYDTKCILILSYITLQFFRQYLKLVYIKIINYNGLSFANLKNTIKYTTSYEKPQTYSNRNMFTRGCYLLWSRIPLAYYFFRISTFFHQHVETVFTSSYS